MMVVVAVDGTAVPDGILAVVDATNLYQGLYLMQQLLELLKQPETHKLARMLGGYDLSDHGQVRYNGP